MADEINVEITRREAIKPCSPTPQHLKNVELSFLDQISFDMYVPLIFFYPFTSNNSHHQNPIEKAFERAQHLRVTLSKSLAHFYPFAGRLRDNTFIECSDEGAEFVEAKAPVSMSEILKNPDPVTLKKLVEPGCEQEPPGGCLLLVKATIFDCGGIALGLSLSHKIADASTISRFVKSWAETARDDAESVLARPEFGRACELFPPILDSSCSADQSSMELFQDKCATRRFVFTAEQIAALKDKSAGAGHGDTNPTRVQAVSGLIWKCAMKASASRLNDDNGSSRASIWRQPMNIRKRIEPPFGDNVIGNLVCSFAVKKEEHEVVDLGALVEKFRKGVEEAAKSYAKKENIFMGIQGKFEEYKHVMKSNEIDYFGSSSWCRFGLYEADFGWEKPVWVAGVSSDFKNTVVLMDARDGDGIEAWMTFNEEDMAFIVRDEELLAFASLNPSVV